MHSILFQGNKGRLRWKYIYRAQCLRICTTYFAGNLYLKKSPLCNYSRKPKLRLYQEEVHAYTPKHEVKEFDVPDEMLIRVDKILEKISLSGKNSLSEEENLFLFKASETIKRKKS